jgi:hypothetical protein
VALISLLKRRDAAEERGLLDDGEPPLDLRS